MWCVMLLKMIINVQFTEASQTPCCKAWQALGFALFSCRSRFPVIYAEGSQKLVHTRTGSVSITVT